VATDPNRSGARCTGAVKSELELPEAVVNLLLGLPLYCEYAQWLAR
jgi:hypothetical protein